MTSSCRRFRAGVISLYILAYLLRNAEIPDPRAPLLGRLSFTSRPKGHSATAIWLQHSRESDLLLRPLIPAFLATKEKQKSASSSLSTHIYSTTLFCLASFFARASCCSISALFRLASFFARALLLLHLRLFPLGCRRACQERPRPTGVHVRLQACIS
jgi:hypothetical protein